MLTCHIHILAVTYSLIRFQLSAFGYIGIATKDLQRSIAAPLTSRWSEPPETAIRRVSGKLDQKPQVAHIFEGSEQLVANAFVDVFLFHTSPCNLSTSWYLFLMGILLDGPYSDIRKLTIINAIVSVTVCIDCHDLWRGNRWNHCIEVNETARLTARFFLLPRSLETWKSNSG